MATYHLSMRNGKSAGAVSNYQYNMGLGKYTYKAQEVKHTINHIPSWANSPEEFWEKYMLEERVNSSYKKIELSLQDELSLEENIKLLNEFLKKNIGDGYYHSVAIHEVSSSKENVKNIHAHIMICKRLEDNLERKDSQFFRRYNSSNPELGGALVDNAYWGKKQTLLNIRESWEDCINSSFEKKGIENRVSCKSLKKQREEALKENNLLLAESLDRPSIHVNHYILKKDEKDLNGEELEKKEYYNDCCQIKTFSEFLYIERLQEQLQNDLEEEHKKETISFTEEIPFDDLFDKKHSLFIMALEIKTLEHQRTDELYLRESAIREISKEYTAISLELDTLLLQKTKNEKNIASLEEKLRSIEDTIPEEKINSIKTQLKEKIDKRVIALKVTEEQLYGEVQIQLEKLTPQHEQVYNEYQYKTWENNYATLYEKKKEFRKLRNDIKKIENKLSKEHLEAATYNSLTNGKYNSLMKDLIGVKKRLENPSNISDREKTRLETRKNNLLGRIDLLKEPYKKGFEKNNFIRRQERIKSNYYKKYVDIKQEFDKSRIEIFYLEKNILNIPKEDQEKFKNTFKERKILQEIQDLKTEKQPLETQEQNLKHRMAETNLQRRTLDIMTEGKHEALIKEYSALKEELKQTENNPSKYNEIENKLENLEERKKSLISELNPKAFGMVKDNLFGELNNVLLDVQEKMKDIEERIEQNEKILHESGEFKGSFSNLQNFSKEHLYADLGTVLYAGNNIHDDNDEDIWNKRMKKEMDFSR